MRNTNTWRWYLALGGLSVLKALALRNNRRRFRRELLDASLFVGLGLLMYRMESDGGSRSGGSRIRALVDGAGGGPTGDQVVRAVDRAEPVVRETVLPALRQRFGEEPEPDRLDRLRRRLPA